MLQIPQLYTDPLEAPETLTEDGARDLAARIMAYWLSRGRMVNVMASREDAHEHARSKLSGARSMWVVRSDMVGGLPK